MMDDGTASRREGMHNQFLNKIFLIIFFFSEKKHAFFYMLKTFCIFVLYLKQKILCDAISYS